MEATTSTSFKSRLTNMPHQDIVVFGLSSDLNDLSLPTKCDILKCYFFLSDRAKFENKRFSYKSFTPQVTHKLIQIWCKLNIEIINRKSVFNKLNGLLDKYQKHIKHRNRDEFKAFVDSINKLFYIGKCNCKLNTTKCSCGLIPEHLKEIMMDQHNDRKFTVPEYTEDIEEVATTIPTLTTGTDENEATTEVPEATVQMRRDKSSSQTKHVGPATVKELDKKIATKLSDGPKRTPKRTRGSISLESNSPSTTPPPVQSNKRRRI